MEFIDRGSISRGVGGELGTPKLAVALGHGRFRATDVSMPKAPVDEYGPSSPSIGDVRRSWQIPVADAEAMAEGVQNRANLLLSSSAVLSNATHSRRRLRVDVAGCL